MNIFYPIPPTPYTHLDPGDGNCNPVTKVKWLNTDANPLIICCGGLSVEQEEEHHTVTVVHGADHIALDFTSPVVDFVPVVGVWDLIVQCHVNVWL